LLELPAMTNPCVRLVALVAVMACGCGTDVSPGIGGKTGPDAGSAGSGVGGSDAGNGTGSGSGSSSNDPLDAAPTCTSGTYYVAAGAGSPTMHPGDACIACHAQQNGEAPSFTLAGTVYPTGHEPDDCDGLDGTAQVVVTDANSAVYTLTPNAVGNFYTTAAVAFPITAKVIEGGTERDMTTPQTIGDCNGCHTQSGANGAPGRICPM
jgi:hypothetical protein